jgi:hypothetical protein
MMKKKVNKNSVVFYTLVVTSAIIGNGGFPPAWAITGWMLHSRFQVKVQRKEVVAAAPASPVKQTKPVARVKKVVVK